MPKIIASEKDAENEKNLSKRSGLSIRQVSDLLRDYVVIPKKRVTAFDSQAIDRMRRELTDTKIENSRLRQQACGMAMRIAELEKQIRKGNDRIDGRDDTEDNNNAPAPGQDQIDIRKP